MTIFLARPEAPGEGVPLAVKDLFDTAGLETTYGSAIFRGHVPERTAEAVARLEAAGCVNVGKTNLHEFAYGITSQNPHYGTVPNPLAPGRLAGGSSGGSAAALAAGLADVALGTDSGGSIRIPASWCGIVGFKPTYGLVPLDGCYPLAPSFDHAGPMSRTVGECEAGLSALLTAYEPRRIEDLEEVSLGVAWTELAEPLVRERVRAAAALFSGARRVDFPLSDWRDRLFMHEVAAVHRELFREHAALYGENVRTKVERCLAVPDAEAVESAGERERYRERCLAALDGLDLLITPTTAFVAPPDDVDDLDIREATIRFTFPFNLLGWPALALPCGPAENGLPASAQIVGRPGDDALVLAVGRLVEASLDRGTARAL